VRCGRWCYIIVHASDAKLRLFSYYPCHKCRGVWVDSQGRGAIGTISVLAGGGGEEAKKTLDR
jgi:Transcription factor zinc-finger